MATLDKVIEELQIQNQKLDTVGEGISSVAKSIRDQLANEKRGMGDTLEDRLEKQRSSGSSSPTTFKGGLVGAIRGDTGLDFLSSVSRWAFNGITGALGALGGGALVASILPMMGAMVGRLITRGPLGAAMLLFGESLILKSFDGLEDYIEIGQDDKKLYAASLSKALTTGLVLSIFNKKLGIAAFFGSLLSDSIKQMFPKDMAWDEKQKLFGLEMPFKKEDFLKYGAIMGSFFAPSLIIGAIKSGLGMASGGPPGTAAAGGDKQRKAFMKGFKPPGFRGLGWAGLLTFTGSLLADWAAEKTGSQKIGDLVKISLTGVSLLALFGTGPIGIAAAVAGVAIHGLMLIKNRMDKKRAELTAEFEAAVDAKEKQLSGMTAAEMDKFATAVTVNAGANAVYGLGTEDDAIAEEAFIRHLEKTSPDKLAAAYASEEAAYRFEEYKRIRMMDPMKGKGFAAKQAERQLAQALENQHTATGKISPFMSRYTDLIGSTGNSSPFANAYSNSASSAISLTDGYTGHHPPASPISVTSGDVNNTTTYHNSGVVLDQGSPSAWDETMGGGIHPFSSMYARGW